jgi:hypothetical protein
LKSCAGSIPAASTFSSSEQLTAAADARLLEDRFQVILHRVAGDEEARGDRARVEAGEQGGDQLTLAPRERVRARQPVERVASRRAAQRDRACRASVRRLK